MMEAVVALYETPGASGDHMSLSAIGEELELSPQKVKKFLNLGSNAGKETDGEIKYPDTALKCFKEEFSQLLMENLSSHVAYRTPEDEERAKKKARRQRIRQASPLAAS